MAARNAGEVGKKKIADKLKKVVKHDKALQTSGDFVLA